VEADVLALIPEEHQGLGISVSVSEPKSVVRDGVTERPEGYFVCLRLGEDRVRVGGKALSTTLADWHDSKTGDLRAMVEEAVSKLIGQGQQAR
jgi:hypothetical protein